MPIHPDIFSDAALRHVRGGSEKPPEQLSARELPPMAVSWASTAHLPTGVWKEKRPVYQRGLSPCLTHCPVGNDVEGYIRLLRDGDEESAARLLAAENPFPATCGRVCYHPCEAGCNRVQFDKSVSIRAIERYLGDLPLLDNADVWRPAREKSGKRVAVVGGGPAGMSCAWALALLGHTVELFERNRRPGGLLRYGIPSYRLPNDVLDREIGRLRALGVRFFTGERKGTIDEIGELLRIYDAVFVASGASTSRSLNLDGGSGAGQVNALEFLRALAAGDQVEVGEHCLVIGGGNSAIDAARSARRLGADVMILYRRTRADMPAYADEIEEAIAEGVQIVEQAVPHALTVENGRVSALTCLRTKPGERDASGRARPAPIPGSDFTLPAATVINAIGEQTDPGALTADRELRDVLADAGAWGESARARLFAGGDFAGAERTVAHAIGSGKRAAMAIDSALRGADSRALDRFRVGGGPASLTGYLSGGELDLLTDAVRVIEYDELNPDYFPHVERDELDRLARGGKPSGFDEIELGWSRARASHEAGRCFSCGKCTRCGLCQIFCPEGAIRRDPETGGYLVMDSICKGCGICVEECPRCAIIMEFVHERRE